jgi:chromosome segregation ATPase
MNSADTSGRLKELEATCEDLRRRLSEERQVKDNFEDLLAALKNELQSSHNERDNLRDEIVPQLRARVEGLEASTAEHEKMTYEQTRMQQELESLKSENATLANARKLQLEMQQQMNRFSRIAEETPPITPRSATLSRSNSVASRAINNRPGSLTRSASVKTKSVESRDALAERVKDIELQRDALHSALKNLLERQEYQNRENEKKICQLELERDRALATAPRRQGYGKDVANLRDEVTALRRRADEAIEQKWQCEKGLAGIKMDLDRAEQEIGSLRNLLQENDILIPVDIRRASTASRPSTPVVTSESLERAYVELQRAYADSLERIKSLESDIPDDEDTRIAMDQLQQSLSLALSERDFARRESDAFKSETSSLKESEKEHLQTENVLADELRDSAQRVEGLAKQVSAQLARNADLRRKLAETIERGESEQRGNSERIYYMQGKLKGLEEEVMRAQNVSEDRVARHEDDMRNLKSAHSGSLLRLQPISPRAFGPKAPLSPLLSPLFSPNSTSPRFSPRLDRTTTGSAKNLGAESEVMILRGRVKELEEALAEAEREMENVVGRMNGAQIEVGVLLGQREEAVRETRRLQAEIEREKMRGFQERFRTLIS